MNVEQQAPGVETRLKHRQRGFYYDKAPGFFGHDDAHARAERQAHKLAGARDALARFGLLQDEDGTKDPVGVLSDLFKFEDFGLPTKGDVKKVPAPKMFRPRTFAGAAPPASSGGAMEFGAGYRPDAAMAYTGA